MKKAIKIILIVIILLAGVVGGYILYAHLAYYRVADSLALTVEHNAKDKAQTGQAYTLVSYNVGFGAYSADYSFFMDGGKYSRAFSRKAVEENMGGAIKKVQSLDPTFMIFQEVDQKADRSYQVDEVALLRNSFSTYASIYAQNYDSPYIFWPLLHPHGKSKSGIVTLSSYHVESSLRRSLPVETGFSKFYDLDRCYSVSRIPVDNGKTLCLYNVHLSAYTTDGVIATQQILLLLGDMKEEYQAGNYVVCGGDFNKDLLGDSGKIFGVADDGQPWSQAFPAEMIPTGFTLIGPLDEKQPVASCRNASEPYNPTTSFQMTCDGFLVSGNVEVVASQVIDTAFAYADHNPVVLRFSLKK